MASPKAFASSIEVKESKIVIDGAYLLSMASRAESVCGDLIKKKDARALSTADRVTPKTGPEFKSPFITEWLKIERKKLDYLLSKHPTLPQGTKENNVRKWTAQEVAELTVKISEILGSPLPKRSDSQLGVTMALGNLKGGVSKSLLSIVAAQCMALMGLKVLFIDTDSQANSTRHLGINPNDFSEEETLICIYPESGGGTKDAVANSREALMSVIQPTYFHNLDIIPANSGLHQVEVRLSSLIMNNRDLAKEGRVPDAQFWEFFDEALKPAREAYDVIVIDTPPSFSYGLLNTLYACDGFVCPIPPRLSDMGSTASFWNLTGDLMEMIDRVSGAGKSSHESKKYAFVDVIITMVNGRWLGTPFMIDQINQSYGNHVMTTTIPDSDAIRNCAATNETLIDRSSPIGNRENFNKALSSLIDFSKHVHSRVTESWPTRRKDA